MTGYDSDTKALRCTYEVRTARWPYIERCRNEVPVEGLCPDHVASGAGHVWKKEPWEEHYTLRVPGYVLIAVWTSGNSTTGTMPGYVWGVYEADPGMRLIARCYEIRGTVEHAQRDALSALVVALLEARHA